MQYCAEITTAVALLMYVIRLQLKLKTVSVKIPKSMLYNSGNTSYCVYLAVGIICMARFISLSPYFVLMHAVVCLRMTLS